MRSWESRPSVPTNMIELRFQHLLQDGVPHEELGITPISADEQRKLLLLYHGEVNEASPDMERIVEQLKLGEDPAIALKLERLLQVGFCRVVSVELWAVAGWFL